MTGRWSLRYPSVSKVRVIGPAFLLCWALFSAEVSTADAVAGVPAVEQPRDETQQRLEQLHERIQRAAATIEEQQQQLSANRNRIALIRGKLKSLEASIDNGLIGQNYVDALLSEIEQLEALSEEMEESIAQAKWSVAEYALEQSRLESDRRRITSSEPADPGQPRSSLHTPDNPQTPLK
ncbi:hypothetical protein KQ940_05450 [Marinobacterium sp. D7]|uniref:hypothetical protein n=1 Tax=Marinobacterium ramblicola TaxID=2849041 RepID=UPI001C2D3B40|nr:hypothetical protein [Marinobacterium ramblicola]MBV1787497.1 hypothetical protein [Marinobacterium ramblicola]